MLGNRPLDNQVIVGGLEIDRAVVAAKLMLAVILPVSMYQ